MPVLPTPFWIVSDRRAGVPTPLVAPGAPGQIVAFTDPERAAAHMAGRGEELWEVGIVTDRTLRLLLEVYRLLGATAFCFDPDAGGCGTVVSFLSVSLHD